jgi:hypothetical protein
VRQAIHTYDDGIGARDVSQMQRAFPSMPSSVRRGWEQLFGAVRSVEARATDLQVGPIEGNTGTAALSLAVTYTSPITKRPCTQTTQLRLQLARAGSNWRITDLTQTGSTSSANCG